jgi:hypothetical protein
MKKPLRLTLITAVGYLASDLKRGLTDADIRESWKEVATAAGLEDLTLSDEDIESLREAAG